MESVVEESVGRTQEGRGAVGWLLGAISLLRSGRSSAKQELKLVETLPLGGRRQLMLVVCGEERYLIGGGPDRVDTMIQVGVGHSQSETLRLSERVER
jgi:flagellar biogenesis protein FliO